MRLSCVTVVLGVLLHVPLFTTNASTQQPIRVVRHVPEKVLHPGDVITISFDRPVAGRLEQSGNPSRFLRITPSLNANVEWRDITTLRVVPNEPIAPGTVYRFTVDTTLTAIDGGRLTRPYRFTVTTRGPRLLSSTPALGASSTPLLDPTGTVTVVYSGAIDSLRLATTARLQIEAGGNCAAATTRYAVASLRPLEPNGEVRVSSYDSPVDPRFGRVAVLRPTSPPPDNCAGYFILPAFDDAGRQEIRYAIRTPQAFQVVMLSCEGSDCAGSPGFGLSFTAPVHRDSLLGRVHFDPPTRFTIDDPGSPSQRWQLRASLEPRTHYRVRVDSSVTDVHGRRLQGSVVRSAFVADRAPTLGHQLGFFTVSRQHPVIRITHVNVDSAEVAFVVIPDSSRFVVLHAHNDQDSIARVVGRLRDTLKLRLALRAKPNEERISEVPIPRQLLDRHPTSLFAIRATPIEAKPIVQGITRSVRGTVQAMELLPPIRIVVPSILPSRRVAVVQVTNLGAHARVAAGTGAAFVTDVNTGRPVAGATVHVRDAASAVIASGTTDRTGVADLRRANDWRPRLRNAGIDWWGHAAYWDEYQPTSVRLIEVVHNNDRSATIVGARAYQSWQAHSDAGSLLGRDEPVRAMIYTDRAIYRPGETVYVGSITRRGWLGALKPLSVGDSVRISVAAMTGADPEVVRDTVLHVTAFGTAADSVVLGSAVPLGEYKVTLAVVSGDTWETRAWRDFRVAEYRAPQFRATLALDSGVRYLGDTVRAHVDASYYFGAPMASAVVRWSVTTERATEGVQIPGLATDFSVATRYNAGRESPTNWESVSGVDTLDARGRVTLATASPRGDLNGPGRVTVHIAVEDLDRQTVVATKHTIAHSSEFYIAARDPVPSWYWRHGEPRSLELFAVRPDGRRLSGVRVGVTVVRHHWTYAYQPGTRTLTSRLVTETVRRDSVVAGEGTTRYRFTPTGNGSFEVLFSARDREGRDVATSLGAWVIAPRWFGWWGSSADALPLRLVRDTVAPGDSVAVEFISPFRHAEAWLTVEREGVLAQVRRRVRQGDVALRVPVTPAFIPGATVSVLLVDESAAWRSDSMHQRVRSGSVALTVDRAAKELRVAVRSLSDRYAPGDSARVEVRLRNRAGAPVSGQVTLWAVDESVLALTDSLSFDPLDVIYAPRATSLRFVTSAGSLASRARLLRPPGWNLDALYGTRAGNGVMLSSSVAVMGMGAGSNKIDVRSDFRTTAFYAPFVRVDASGNATTAVKLPDNVTSYRIFAVAVGAADQYGSGESTLVVTKPLIVRSALPRFLRPGDEFRAGAVMTNQTGAAVSATMNASATMITATRDVVATQTVPNGTSTEVRFDWRANAAPGESARMRFTVAGGDANDGVETSLPVRAPYSPRFHAFAGVARRNQLLRLPLPAGVDPVRSRLTIRVGATPSPAVAAAYERLQVYPYFCSEQLSSAARAIVAVLRLHEAGLVDSARFRPAVMRDRLQFVVDELSRRQLSDGGIGYWSGASWTTASLTAYAGSLLLDARDLGTVVRPVVTERVAEYLRKSFDTTFSVSPVVDTEDAMRSATRQFGFQLAAVHFLRRAGFADETREDMLLSVEKDMLWEDRVWLAELLAARSDRSRARLLLSSVWRDVDIADPRLELPVHRWWSADFRSNVRPAARLLRATLALDPSHPYLERLIDRTVHQGTAVRTWAWNTQDYAAAAEALATVALSQRAQATGTVVVRSTSRGAKGRVLLSGDARATHHATTSLDGLLEKDGRHSVLPLSVSGDRVYYSVTVEEVPLVPPTTPDAQGIVVERWFERFDNGQPVTTVQEGDLVRGRIRITVPDTREFVAVADPLPAGLEVVDLSLRTSVSLGAFATPESEAAARAGDAANRPSKGMYGAWWGGWWSPWEHTELRDDRVLYFARTLWRGTYTASYVARATTAGTFTRPPAHAEEMYNPALGGRSDGGKFIVTPRP